ncbi:hypothetical protein JYK22_05205, partial [Nonomuraea sp. RK-328]|nr:hypothetical protein [Nonomuraea sp. RK-328]
SRRHAEDRPHLRNVDTVTGPPFAGLSVEVDLVAEGDGQPYVLLGVTDERARSVSDDPSDVHSWHRLDLELAAALGHVITHLDPRGCREVAELLVQ